MTGKQVETLNQTEKGNEAANAEVEKLKMQIATKENQISGLAGQMKTAGILPDFAKIKQDRAACQRCRSPSGKGKKKGEKGRDASSGDRKC